MSARLSALRFSPWPGLVGLGLIIWGQWRWFKTMPEFWAGAVPVLLGLMLVVLSLRPQEIAPEQSALIASVERRRLVWGWRLPFALAGVALSLYTGWRAVSEQGTVWDFLLMWGIAIWLTIYGLVPHEDAVAWWKSLRRNWREERTTWLVVGGISFVGTLLRVAGLGTSPYIQAGDEAAFAIEAVDIKDRLHWITSPFKYGIWHHPLVYMVMIGAAVEVFGQTVAASRLPSAILGSLTVPAVYFMGRRMFDRRIGLVAAIFMAAYPLHVHFSRTGINQVGDPLFTALTFGFLTRTLRDGDRMEAALAGLSLGLSQYFYSAARIVPFLIVGYVGFFALRHWRNLWERAGALLITLIVAGVVVFPNLYAVYRDVRPISPRLHEVGIWETGNVQAAAQEHRLTEYWTTQVNRSFMAYVQIPDESGFYGPYNPILGWYAGVPFLIGLIIILCCWRDPRYVILGIWVAATSILGGVLLVDPPHYPRFVSVAPGLAVIVALGMVWIGQTGARLLSALRLLRERQWISYAQKSLPILFVLVLGVADQRTYIVDYLPKKLVYGEPTVQLNEVADILNSFDDRYTVLYLSSPSLDMSATGLIRYQAPDHVGTEYKGEVEQLPTILPRPGAYAFVVAPEREEEIGLLVFQLPGGDLREYQNQRSGKPLVYVYFVDVPE